MSGTGRWAAALPPASFTRPAGGGLAGTSR